MLINSFKGLVGAATFCTPLVVFSVLPAGADTTLPASSTEIANSFPDAISADGTTVVGVMTFAGGSEQAFRWTTTGLTNLGTLGGHSSGTQDDFVSANGFSSEAYAVNADGSVVVGAALTAANLVHAFRWTAAGMVDLGTLAGGSSSGANGVSADGSVIVGQSTLTGGSTHAFRWTATSNAMTDLNTLGGTNSNAQAVSSDGNVVVGSSDIAGNAATHAFRWTTASMTDLNTLGGTNSTAVGVNSTGTVIVGYSDTTGNVATHAYRWTTAGMADLGTLAGGDYSAAYGVNANGSVVVGVASTTTAGGNTRGFRWTQADGMITVDNWLRAQGVPLTSGDITSTAQGVSADGNVIVGQTRNYGSYIARGATTVPTSGTSSTASTASAASTTQTKAQASSGLINGASQIVPAGLMNVATYQQSLASTPRTTAAVQGADMTINGDNSSPMYALLEAGQSSAWASGDLGRVYTQAWGGTSAVGEVGVAHSPVQGLTTRIAVGRTYARQNLNQGGDSRTQGTYVLPEATLALGHQFYGTLTGYANWGDFAVRRGYTNGDGLDISSGAAGTQTYGFRARVDWLNAYRIASTNLSPYVSFTRTSTYVGHYTETGGAFPAFFNGGTQNADVSRLGSDAVYPLTSWLSLLGRAEYAHRFEGHGNDTTGTILGLSDFDLAGLALRQNWVRGGIGLKALFGPGEGFLMFNASNQTSGATYWLNANYRVLF